MVRRRFRRAYDFEDLVADVRAEGFDVEVDTEMKGQGWRSDEGKLGDIFIYDDAWPNGTFIVLAVFRTAILATGNTARGGRDLADGKLSRNTWKEILRDIEWFTGERAER